LGSDFAIMTSAIYHRGYARFDLPASLSREIGRIVVRWAYLEFVVQQIIWNLAQVTFPVGRLAVREPRLEDRIVLVRHLAELRGINLPEKPVATLQTNSRTLARERDILAHGYWFFEDGQWRVVLTRGKWPDNDPHPSSKSIVPEALVVTTEDLRKISEAIEVTINLTSILSVVVSQHISPPPEVHPEQLPRRVPKQGRKPSARGSRR
jgi:hypothetical protein